MFLRASHASETDDAPFVSAKRKYRADVATITRCYFGRNARDRVTTKNGFARSYTICAFVSMNNSEGENISRYLGRGKRKIVQKKKKQKANDSILHFIRCPTCVRQKLNETVIIRVT